MLLLINWKRFLIFQRFLFFAMCSNTVYTSYSWKLEFWEKLNKEKQAFKLQYY